MQSGRRPGDDAGGLAAGEDVRQSSLDAPSVAKDRRFEPRTHFVRARGRLVVEEKKATFRLQQLNQSLKLTRRLAPSEDADAQRKSLVEATVTQIE